MNEREVEILLVEDNPGDARLTLEAFKQSKTRPQIRHLSDGAEALTYLRQEGCHANSRRPNLVLLDLNLPGLNGRQVLAALKSDPRLRLIPVIIMTTSQAPEDIKSVYNLHANCYIPKPLYLDDFMHVVRVIEEFWLTIVKLPV